jgi:hypothetical protein
MCFPGVLSGKLARTCFKNKFLGLKAKSSGAKAQLNPSDLRGPFGKLRAGSEGPLFHGCTGVPDFFSRL